MIPAQASRTAYRVALRRATHQLLDAPPVFVDPVAIDILGPETAAALRADPARFDDAPFGPAMRAFMAVRARFAVVQDMSPQALHERYLADRAERPKLSALARLLWAGAEAYGV